VLAGLTRAACGGRQYEQQARTRDKAEDRTG
jgi:hypothetical protein